MFPVSWWNACMSGCIMVGLGLNLSAIWILEPLQAISDAGSTSSLCVCVCVCVCVRVFRRMKIHWKLAMLLRDCCNTCTQFFICSYWNCIKIFGSLCLGTCLGYLAYYFVSISFYVVLDSLPRLVCFDPLVIVWRTQWRIEYVLVSMMVFNEGDSY